MNSELYHYGIKGMRWGVRRFQNADGSYTSAGKARYNTGSRNTRIDRMESKSYAKARKAVVKESVKKPKAVVKSKDFSDMSNEELRSANARYRLEKQYNSDKENKVTGRLEGTRTVFNESSNIANRTRELSDRITNRENKTRPMKKMDLSHMTDQELRDRINRGNLERQYTQLYGTPEVASGRERVATVLDYAGTVLAIGGSAASIALAVHQMRHLV